MALMDLHIDDWPTNCTICGKKRTFKEVDVKKIDLSAKWGFDEGGFIRNVSYCNDNPECIKKAQALTADDFKCGGP